jgi:ArsR family transcriptional regulator
MKKVNMLPVSGFTETGYRKICFLCLFFDISCLCSFSQRFSSEKNYINFLTFKVNMHIIAYMIHEVEIYKAIGEETRLRILRLLIKAKRELCACELMDVLDKPQYTISKCLGILVKAGILAERRDGRMMFYKLNDDNDFNTTIFENIGLIKCKSNPAFEKDFLNLSKRLALRVKGKCVSDCKH